MALTQLSFWKEMQIFLQNNNYGEFECFFSDSLLFCIKFVYKKDFIFVLIYDIIYLGDLGEAVKK